MIIGITGFKKAGKDTCADFLIQSYGYERLSFARPLKEFIASITPFTFEDLNNQDIKDIKFEDWQDYKYYKFTKSDAQKIEDFFIDNGYSDFDKEEVRNFILEPEFTSLRHLMQWFGTDLGRQKIHGNIWVEIGLKSVKNKHTIVSDVRFENEAKAILDAGGIILKINRPSLGDNTDLHPSEMPIDDKYISVIIENDASISTLESNILLWHTLKFKNIESK